MAYQLVNLPPSLKVLFLVTLTAVVLALAWLHLIWFVNFPPSTWTSMCMEKKRAQRNKKYEEKNLDSKSRRTAPRHGLDAVQNSQVNRGITSATHTPIHHRYKNRENNVAAPQDIELTLRCPRPSSDDQTRPPASNIMGHASGSSPRKNNPGVDTVSPSDTVKLQSSTTPWPSYSLTPRPFSSPSSPALHNPVAGIHPRSSLEWLRQRAIFFGEDNNNNNNNNSNNNNNNNNNMSQYTLSTQNPPHSLYSLDTIDMQALEEGTAALTGHARATRYETEEISVLRKSLSWLDQGLGMVDGAVDRVVERVARWTDDDGGDEPLLLPVTNEKVVKVE